MMVSFVLSFFPRDVLDEILNLIESVSEDFPSYFCMGKSENFMLFGNCGSHRPQTSLNIQIKELMKLNEYQRSRSLFDLGQRSLRFQNLNLFLLETI